MSDLGHFIATLQESDLAALGVLCSSGQHTIGRMWVCWRECRGDAQGMLSGLEDQLWG